MNYQYDDPKSVVPAIIATNWPPKNWPPRLLKASMRELSTASETIAESVTLDPRLDRITIESKNSKTNDRLKTIIDPENLTSTVASGSRYLLVFSNVKSEQQLGGFYEIYVDTPEDWKPSIESPHYVGNLTLFGATRKSRELMHSMQNHQAMDGISVEIDITEKLRDLTSRSRLWKNSVEITLVRAGVENEKGEVLPFNPEANLEIGKIELLVVPDAGFEKE
jgi:hypothetical protein